MAISLDEINRVTLRVVFLPWFKHMMADLGLSLPEGWNPSDEELEKLAARVGEALREGDAAPR